MSSCIQLVCAVGSKGNRCDAQRDDQLMVELLVGGALTLFGGAGGSLLTWWLGERSARRLRDRDLRLAQREHAIEVMAAGQEWATNLTGVIFALAGMDLDTVMKQEAWLRQEPILRRYRTALAGAQLLLIEDAVHEAADGLSDHLKRQTEVMDPLGRAHLQGLQPSDTERDAALAYCEEHEGLLNHFKTTARNVLVSSKSTPVAARA